MIGEAALALVLAIGLSILASALNESLGGALGKSTEQRVRFAAGFSMLFAITAAVASRTAAVASRGVRRHRAWSWTLAALLQLVLAIGTGFAVVTAVWHPAYLLGFGLATVVMLVLSTASVRRALGQE
jgi:low temperature requirement protein LtrA